jgi:hypothetical protein
VSLPLRIEAIENEDGEVDPDLGSSEASAVGRAIRGEHISDQHLQRRPKVNDRTRGRVHHRSTPSNDGVNGT